MVPSAAGTTVEIKKLDVLAQELNPNRAISDSATKDGTNVVFLIGFFIGVKI
jgi:hypothetical protein